ncbi:3-dehydroquinate dehydratase [Alkalithermobacter thermoalcaliphilus JW-YL-7 = DSM 7308]|uniref:3-dehydroquinate dehydratase n=1 Tax=Alkalithermobacter thermoalcaliphilus JW-YL-7 = DSM 7308 TaxID=1121328 RepID=A0A150FR45_CLOPD|nr:3-dehydroquinate dehydratase [[Clostridium] paradoxum JW-YL-7 = DSM 7308]SHL00638.1 3-dehydroquinate dehydratase [[Clostridium] paradoxum JW-YL-7 = DSM 7308]
MEKILVINGPNLNLIGQREQEIYGNSSMKDLEQMLKKEAESLNVSIDFFQSNHEGYIIDKLHKSQHTYSGIILNPAAYTHYSYAIYDAIRAIKVPTVEVHISNIHAREEFRQKSVTAKACIGQISGFGLYSYVLGLYALLNHRGRK